MNFSDDELKTMMDAVSNAASKVTLEGVLSYAYQGCFEWEWEVSNESNTQVEYVESILRQFKDQKVRITIERLPDV